MRDHNDSEKSFTDREVLSIDEAAEFIGIGKTLLGTLIKAGTVPARRVGPRRILILRSDLLAWLKALPRLDAAAA